MQDFRNYAAQGTAAQVDSRDMGLRAYMLKIYNYMASALLLTGIVALFSSQSPAILGALYQLNEFGQPVAVAPLGYVMMFAPLVAILALSFGIQRMSVPMAQACFWGFAVIMGVSMASIFLVYTGESIARTFFITAGTFGAMSIYGYTTKKDLTGWGSFLFMGVIGLIIASVVNMFLHSSGLAFAISAIGVLVFTGLTAYDTQKLKQMYYVMANQGDALAKASIMGALNLYLDFINLFIMLLRFVGDRR
jgi:uncharacterized protein